MARTRKDVEGDLPPGDVTGTKSVATPPGPDSEGRWDPLVRRFVEALGQASQSLGFGRALGQVYALVLFSPAPQSLDDLTRHLGISKGGASMTVRQLEQWGALRRVWIRGDRKDYYEACDSFGRIMRRALVDLVGRQMETVDALLDEAEEALAGDPQSVHGGNPQAETIRQRLKRVRQFRRRAQGLWDNILLQLLLK